MEGQLMDKDVNEHISDHADTLIRELHAEMRAIREADLKMLPFFYASAAFVLPAHVLTVLNDKAGLSLVLWVAIPLFTFICVMWWQLHRQLADSNSKYRDLGQRIRTIWQLWQVSSFCAPNEGGSELGEGKGVKRTQLFLAATAICVLLIL
jgi:hypothetical protein